VFNIIDGRTNEFNPNCDVVFEVFADDWTDYNLPANTKDFTEWVTNTSIYSALMVGMKFSGCVTIYFYDEGMVPRDHGYLAAVHPKLKKHQLNMVRYDPKLLRNY